MKEGLPNYHEKIRLYLKGELSKTDEELLFDWLNQSSENLDQFQTFVRANEFELGKSPESETAWKLFLSKLDRQNSRKQDKTAFISWRWSKIAAILIVALLAGFWGINRWTGKQQKTQFCEISVPYGQKTQVDLADGSKVWLNAGTSFRYPRSFSGEIRQVEIDGEGYFEVAKDKEHPFIVKTVAFEVKVMGTSFNLSSYKSDEYNSLALLTGSVQLSTKNKQQKIMLTPGDKAILNKQSNSIRVVQSDVENSASWREDVLIFDDLSLSEISKLLERHFDVKIQIRKDKIRQIRYSGRFKSDEGLNEILDIIRETSPVKFNYKQNDKEGIIIE